ncbi:MarR family winged helix-turn-helix transcriptional regulator [Streptomyces sp. NBC_00620]|uniref:MarR family winged helix-turn-helix transcriptional regulator n=1 Tax=Streptomyces sp. NBC_00620 TaxID=2903666 RepID=UPI0022544B9F|nr:MarR family winged helix-turn-helix transcriptional regulator [Streptomyces sp. NBC_00620]MCX4974655.1 MarR family winged helix-turn-helix transcriptional regulator [Streptomyces sp. NBC_00620]
MAPTREDDPTDKPDETPHPPDSPATRPPTLLALPSYLAGHVARIGHRTLVEALREHGLRLPHFAILAGLGDFGPLAQHELADRLGLNRSHLVGYLDEVEQQDLVHRERDPRDRRRQRVALTAAGETRLEELKKVADRSQADFLSDLSATERETLITLMRRIVTTDDRAANSPPKNPR